MGPGLYVDIGSYEIAGWVGILVALGSLGGVSISQEKSDSGMGFQLFLKKILVWFLIY